MCVWCVVWCILTFGVHTQSNCLYFTGTRTHVAWRKLALLGRRFYQYMYSARHFTRKSTGAIKQSVHPGITHSAVTVIEMRYRFAGLVVSVGRFSLE